MTSKPRSYNGGGSVQQIAGDRVDSQIERRAGTMNNGEGILAFWWWLWYSNIATLNYRHADLVNQVYQYFQGVLIECLIE